MFSTSFGETNDVMDGRVFDKMYGFQVCAGSSGSTLRRSGLEMGTHNAREAAGASLRVIPAETMVDGLPRALS